MAALASFSGLDGGISRLECSWTVVSASMQAGWLRTLPRFGPDLGAADRPLPAPLCLPPTALRPSGQRATFS